jgi:hypothetical protein
MNWKSLTLFCSRLTWLLLSLYPLQLSFFCLCLSFLCVTSIQSAYSSNKATKKVSSNIPFTNPYNKIFSRLIDLPAIFKPTDVSYQFPDALRRISHLRNKWRAINLDKEGSLFLLVIFEFVPFKLKFATQSRPLLFLKLASPHPHDG